VNYALVGAFVLMLTAVLIAGVLWIASGGTLRKHYDLYLAIATESVAGLNLNAPVKYSGVEVGKVSDIQLDPRNPQHVRLTFAIERGTPIKQDTVAVLKIQGLTGIAYVELGGGSRDSPPLLARSEAPYPEIPTKPSLSSRLENVLSTVLTKLDRTSSNIDALLSNENRAALTSALADIAVVARTIAARKDAIDAGIANAARAADNGARVTAQLGPVIERIGRGADAVEAMGNEVAVASKVAARTVGAVGVDVRQFAAETLPEVQRLLEELNVLSNSLTRLSEQTARDPAGLLRGRSPVPPGPGESSTAQGHP
jgi:phospholipid/cholesterol/gamma-HCH transport system substrate-binding protein